MPELTVIDAEVVFENGPTLNEEEGTPVEKPVPELLVTGVVVLEKGPILE